MQRALTCDFPAARTAQLLQPFPPRLKPDWWHGILHRLRTRNTSNTDCTFACWVGRRILKTVQARGRWYNIGIPAAAGGPERDSALCIEARKARGSHRHRQDIPLRPWIRRIATIRSHLIHMGRRDWRLELLPRNPLRITSNCLAALQKIRRRGMRFGSLMALKTWLF